MISDISRVTHPSRATDVAGGPRDVWGNEVRENFSSQTDANFAKLRPMRVGSLLALGLVLLAVLTCAAAGWLKAERDTALEQNRAGDHADVPVIYEGLKFASRAALDRHLRAENLKQVLPAWYIGIPSSWTVTLTAMAFGCIGGFIRILYDLVQSKTPITSQSAAAISLSALTGLLILAFSIVIPSALTVSEVHLRPSVLLFLCLIAGIFSEHIIGWAKERVEKMFERKPVTPTIGP